MDYEKHHPQEQDWRRLIEEAFFEAWQEASTVDITDSMHIIKSHFDLDAVHQVIDSQLRNAQNRESDTGYHAEVLKRLTQAFVEALLMVSDDGKVITHRVISKAKEMMMAHQNAKTYLC
jgi:hypothetical protein